MRRGLVAVCCRPSVSHTRYVPYTVPWAPGHYPAERVRWMSLSTKPHGSTADFSIMQLSVILYRGIVNTTPLTSIHTCMMY